ncbi:MAG: hypothetical protein ACW964_04755 [Candidatus Hodarchaeales archaeon]|jgi:DNA-binding transcriptional ArsR family regulator
MNNSSEAIIKAISNSKRLEIYNFIVQTKFVIKSEILNKFDLKRASLDFHLDSLEEAELIAIKEIRIKGRKYVYLFPKARWKIAVTPLETASLEEFLPSDLSEKEFFLLTENSWLNSPSIKDPQTIRIVLESLAIRLGAESEKYRCKRCETELGIIKCSECQKLHCPECAEIIMKSDEKKVALCYTCITNQFS